ncbi:hypothetical protein C8Q80DRAFT_1271442 [Daedaleopsis nitida]|nr:hypothetical protein C8Q80DRAFT_1271442 [Daedaleopsis nitida]
MQQASYYGSGLSSYGFDGLGLPMSQPTMGSQADLNTPETFKHNIQLVQGQLARVQTLARNALLGIQYAYQPGTNPIQTAADIASLRQTLLVLVELLRQSGVGALPLEPPQVSESVLVEEEGRVVQSLYDRHKRIQDGAGVVAGYLSFASGTGASAGLGGSGDQASSSGARRPQT